MTRTQTQHRNPAALRAFPPGKCIFKEGDTGTTMYLVISGEVKLKIGGKTVETVRKGGVLGEMALLNRGPRTATAIAHGDCTLRPIAQKQFSQLIGSSPDFSLQIMQTIADRLRKMNRRYQMPAVAADVQARKIKPRVRKLPK